MPTGIRLGAVTALVAASVVLSPTPAQAAACATASGVTVVVDFDELGGGVQVACVPDQGDANALFVAAGHSLEQVQQQPGFVCRVDGLPTEDDEACVRTPPPDAYWGLWWSDGDSGTWSYATQGAYDLDVPDGGSVALSWNDSSSREQPGAAPPDHTTDEPTAGSTGPPASGGGDGPRSGVGAGRSSDGSPPSTPTSSTAPDGSASTGSVSGPRRPGDRERAREIGPRGQRGDRADRTREDRRGDRDRDRGGATADAADATTVPPGSEVTSEPARVDDGGGLPGWVAPALIAGLFAVAGSATYLRRRAA